MKALAFLLLIILFCHPQSIRAAALGVHVLHPSEITEAASLLKPEGAPPVWTYITIPLSLADLEKRQQWQEAFDQAKKHQFIPLVRLTTSFDPQNNAWKIPNHYEIIQFFTFLNALQWPYEKRYVIIFNEPNHRSEWGGQIDPSSYAQILRFSANWAHTEKNGGYVVLPAAMDLAAPNGDNTMEAFAYLQQMLQSDPEIFTIIDYWNSHSYPNPAFSAPAQRRGKNSLHGFLDELSWLNKHAQVEPKVFITETGWEENALTRNKLSEYYQYANEHIWSHEKVIAVTPFVFKGDPGPFSKFSFIDKNDVSTKQFAAYSRQVQHNLERLKQTLERTCLTWF